MEYPIDDARDASFFKVCTFSKYQKTKVKEQWLEALKSGDREAACYWTTEMVCSGQFVDLWDLILHFYGKFVNLGNPKLALYLDCRFQLFRTSAEGIKDELELRNKMVVRQLFAEIVGVLCLSAKRPGTDQVKVKKEDLNLMESTAPFKAPNSNYAKPFFKDQDPVEVYAPLNEMCFALSGKQTLRACYWIEWILLFERAKKPAPRCASRGYVTSKKNDGDLIWMIWEILIAYVAEGLPHKIANATFNLFRLHYSPSANERRRFLLYYMVTLCCDPFDAETPIVGDKAALEEVVKQCNTFYRDIRKHSIRIKTD